MNQPPAIVLTPPPDWRLQLYLRVLPAPTLLRVELPQTTADVANSIATLTSPDVALGTRKMAGLEMQVVKTDAGIGVRIMDFVVHRAFCIYCQWQRLGRLLQKRQVLRPARTFHWAFIPASEGMDYINKEQEKAHHPVELRQLRD